MPRLERRAFLSLCSACAAFLIQAAHPQTVSRAAVNKSAVKSRKNFIALQVKPFSWVDEGVDQVLDNLQQKGNVNTIFAYTFDYEESRLKKDGAIPLPDHGVSGSALVGGAFYDYDPKYFQKTVLRDFRAKDYGKFNVIAEVAPKAKARGMDFFAWDYNNADPIMARSIPNLPEVAEIDVYGLRTTSPCFNHPDYRAFLTGKIESLLSGYPGQVDGLAWGCERQGPGDLGGTGDDGIPATGSVVRCGSTRPAAGGRLLCQLLATAAGVSRDSELGETLDGQLSRGPVGAVWNREGDCSGKAIRIPHYAKHDLQPVLSGR